MSATSSTNYLDTFLNYERMGTYPAGEAFTLDRVRALLAALKDPHRKYPTLHVAGTKGKGSTCAFAASIFSAAGLRVGLYTSPHLHSFRERIRVDGVPIGEEELARTVSEVRDAILRDSGSSAARELTYFEVTTACAFLYFARAGVDAAVAEVGLGGRLDATNVMAPEVTAITPVSLDHTAQLGGTLEAIAAEKAGILKRGVPVVMAPQAPEAEKVIREIARAVGVPVHAVRDEVQVEEVWMDLSGSRATLRTPVRRYEGIRIPLLGRHQVDNCAAAVRMAELLAERPAGRPVPPEAVHEGIARTEWPVRLQLVEGKPPVLLDGAQNAESARALVRAVEDLLPNRRVTLVVGCSAEKDLQGMARVWGPWAAQVIVTRAGSPRAEQAGKVVEEFRRFHPQTKVVEPVARALAAAMEKAGPEGVVVVSGSLFVAADAQEFLWRGGVCGGVGNSPAQHR
ncbi:MAG: bifunctional folylpolyglutamate synthase/dihydrofolate synthase [Candidatus Omnitrophica bacterium]|nr:bifunctional folylpolyglutamate synthase/dihydrofolate synthase [Candidatus Omnitrophota bacterium]